MVWFYLKNTGAVLRGGYFRFKSSYLEKFPVPGTDRLNVLNKTSKHLNCIIEYDLSQNTSPHSTYEKINDSLVFQLYFPDHMKEKGIDILKFVELDFKETLGEDDFEQLPDEQKENVIEELHKRWSNPDSEIVKRMNSFAEKSPDILKPILESK